MFDALIVGGGAAGMSCALVLGSAGKREYVSNKKIGIVKCRFCGTPLRYSFVDLGMQPLCESYLSINQLNQMEPQNLYHSNYF